MLIKACSSYVHEMKSVPNIYAADFAKASLKGLVAGGLYINVEVEMMISIHWKISFCV